jgi:multiple sugar transport system permease protein
MITKTMVAIRRGRRLASASRGGSASRSRARRLRYSAGRLSFLAPAAVYLGVVFAYPVGFNIWISFRRYGLSSLITGSSQFVGLQNYSYLFGDANTREAFRNTLVFTFVSMAFQYVIGLALALFFFRPFPFSKVLRALMLLPWLLPGLVSTTAWKFLFREPTGLVNQLFRFFGLPAVPWLSSGTPALVAVIIVNIWIGISFNMVLLHGGLQGIPAERLEAGQLDGASAWQRFRYLILPALRPVTQITLTLGFIYTLKQFDIIWVLTKGGPGYASQVLSTWSYTLAFVDNDFGLGSAAANGLLVLSIGAAVLFLRRRARSAA